jgi:2,3-bisphosphoglycerate-independent phosphoglycerate mutase
MCNFAAPDMVGHTGMYGPAVAACEECDRAIGEIVRACQENGYTLMITADHGNAEEMEDENGKPKTSHTTNLIPLIVAPAKGLSLEWIEPVNAANKAKTPAAGLSSVAPTILTIMGLDVPKEMTGEPLVKLCA